jgi:Holliday junction resolvase
MWDQTLERDFERVEGQPNEQVRGRLFEDVIRKLFERSRFHVTRNAGAATPRQTDLFARRGDEEYLIEVKWRNTPTDVSDLGDLNDRL